MNQADIVYAEAKAYAYAKPYTKAPQLLERFELLMPDQARKIIHAARKAAHAAGNYTYEKKRPREEIIAPAEEYARANPTITALQLRQLFPMGRDRAREILRSVRAKSDELIVAKSTVARNAEAARKVVAEDPSVSCEAVAVQYGVSATGLRRWRRMHLVTIAFQSPPVAQAERPPARLRNRLVAIVDGSTVCPRAYGDVSKIERFHGVKV